MNQAAAARLQERLQELSNDLCLQAQTKSNAQQNLRWVVAVAGPPGAGKSTLSAKLKPLIEKTLGPGSAAVFPMDGFHLDNSLLDLQGSRDRKGAPHTFDVQGFAATLARIVDSQQDIVVPVFDREHDLSRAGARIITAQHRIILVEGNYLLLDQAPWQDLYGFFDYRIYLDVPLPELSNRLVQRWLDHNHTQIEAEARAESNDLPNARLVSNHRLPADLTLRDGFF